jgi:hypothetical protein
MEPTCKAESSWNYWFIYFYVLGFAIVNGLFLCLTSIVRSLELHYYSKKLGLCIMCNVVLF